MSTDSESDSQYLPYGLRLSRDLAEHAEELLMGRMRNRDPRPHPHLPGDIEIQLEKMVNMYLEAWNNRVVLPYELEDLCKVAQSKVPKKDEVLRTQFLGPFPENDEGRLRLVSQAMCWVDRAGNVLGWYFPNLFPEEISNEVMEAVEELSGETEKAKSVLAQSREAAVRKGERTAESNVNWRGQANAFARPEKCKLEPGQVNMSICWYNQGHGPQNDKPPGPSASLDKGTGSRQFLESMERVNALIGTVLSLVHPVLYQKQIAVLEAIYGPEFVVGNREWMEELFESWSTPFNAFSLVVNRESIMHRDKGGGPKMLDILATFGHYSGGRLEIPLLGCRLIYNPGTIVVFPGYLMEHGASVTKGERVCIASFFRPNVGQGALGCRYRPADPPSEESLIKRFDLPNRKASNMRNGGIWV